MFHRLLFRKSYSNYLLLKFYSVVNVEDKVEAIGINDLKYNFWSFAGKIVKLALKDISRMLDVKLNSLSN